MILYIANRNIRVDNADNQISYNSDYIAEFVFDDEWNGKIKTARFVQNGEYVDVVLVDDRCEIPPLKTGFVRIGVFTDSMTSTYADVYYKTSIKDGTGNPTEPPEDVYAQLIALIESGMLKGEDGLTPYVGSNNNWWIGDIDTGILARGYTPVKGVDYFTTEEVQQIQNEVSESIQANINHLEINKADKSELDKTNLSLDALWKLNRGQTWDTLEAESEAYSVDVPSGAKYVGIDMVGGKSVVFEQRIKPEHIEASKEVNGITFTNNGDGTITVSGTATANASFIVGNDVLTGSLKNKPFVLTGCPNGGSNDTYYIGVGYTGQTFKWDKGAGYYTADGYNYGYVLAIHILSGTVIDTPITFKPNLFIINTSEFPSLDTFKKMFLLDYYPYCEPTIISSQNDRVDVRGKNLFNNGEVTVYSAYLRNNGDGIAPSWQYSDESKSIRIPCEPNTTYTISLSVKSLIFRVGSTPSDLAPLTWGNTVPLTQRIDSPNSKSVTYTTGESDKYLIVQIGFSAMDKFISDGQIEKGSTATDYKPYSLQQITTGFPVLNSAGDVYDYIDLNEGKLYTWTYIEDNEVKALAEPIIKPINIPSELADWLTVEAGGSITFHNADEGKRLLIPNKLSFVRKLDEVSV